jgi:hypothetical protein
MTISAFCQLSLFSLNTVVSKSFHKYLVNAFFAWSSSSSLSTKKRTLFASPVFRNNFIIPAAVNVFPVQVAISKRNLFFHSSIACWIDIIALS